MNLAPHGYHSSHIPRCLWSPHGYTSLLAPEHNPPQDITIFMDVALNPGPSFVESQSAAHTMGASLSDNQHGDFDPVIAFSSPSKGLKDHAFKCAFT